MKTFAASLGSMLFALALALGAHAEEAFEAKLSLSAAAQGGSLPAPAVEKVKVSADALLNVARGRSPEADVPPNEVLAFVIDCEEEDARLVVLDPGGPTVLAEVASTSAVDVAFDLKQGVIVAELDVEEDVDHAGNDVNGGYLVVAGKFKIGAGDCPVSINAAVSGVIGVTITDDVGTESFDVLVTKGKLQTGKDSIATLP